MSTFKFPDDSSRVNVQAFPRRKITLGMLVLNLAVWLHAAAAMTGELMPF